MVRNKAWPRSGRADRGLRPDSSLRLWGDCAAIVAPPFGQHNFPQRV